MSEFTTSALLLTVFGLLLLTSVVSSRGIERAGVPVAFLFLGLGMLAGEEGLGGVVFEDYTFAFRLGTIALVLILLDGGLNTKYAAVRASLAPSLVLATFGVVATAALVAGTGMLLGLSFEEAVLLGVVVSSTDAATVFAVLRGSRLRLEKRVATTLELESGLNDPMAVILTVAVTEWLLGTGASHWELAWQVPLQMVVGAAMGLVLGFSGRWLLRTIRVSAGGLYPVATLGIALLAFGLATTCQGSGFLAVYVAAVVIGNGRIPYRSSLNRIHDALAWLSQVAMFLMLGLLVYPSRLLDVAWTSIAVGLFMAILVRPIAVALCLAPFRYPWRETAYVGWVGLRGAVPIILAIYPIIAGVPHAERVFDIVFFVVVVNALVPGSTIRFVTRWVGLETPSKPAPAAVLEIASTQLLDGELISYQIDPSLVVCDAAIADIPFPEGASIALVVRGNTLVAAKGRTILRDGDHVYIFVRPADLPLMSLLFGQPESGT